ncbi:MAG: trypsin-like peptidase domain-containing protein [Anaerolineae bacterium]|nr:trypsin-like peptidase domain-containing protein [Anaerolineae bacterium]
MRRIRWFLAAIAAAAITCGAIAPAYGAALPAPAAGCMQQDAGDWRCVEVNGQLALNVRNGPGIGYQVIGTRPPGDRFEADYRQLQSTDGFNWVPVRYPGGEGWTITARLSPCESDYSAPDHEVVLNGVNQDGELDRFEIALIARSVVLLANVQGDYITSTGTGTITTPDGLIVTNAHVVEDAQLVGVALLNDINDPPDFRYLGEVIRFDADIDAALIAIRYDMDGNPLQAASLNLPYIPAAVNADEVFRGDDVYIFGYPGIGDDYLVVTIGSIVSVENGQVAGRRMPVWYRTDAELAPGNSGGLAVNGNGQFIGIPTFVRSEEETGGRLGGIRPAEVALMTVLGDEATSMAATFTTPTPAPPTPSLPLPPVNEEPVTISLENLRTDHGVIVEGLPGITFTLSFTITGWQALNATVYARLYYDNVQSIPLVNALAPEAYRDGNNVVAASYLITPCCEETIYEDVILFVPYEAFGFQQPGSYALKVKIEIVAQDKAWHRMLSWEYITYTRP